MIMNHKGFSLIEIMIAVGLLATMSLMINSIMGRTLSAKSKVERRDDLLHSTRLSLGKMTEDLSQAFLASSTMQGQNASYKTGMKGSESQIDFSTLSHFHYQKNANDTDQVTVGYILKSNELGFYDLIRRETQRLSDKIDEGGDSFVLMENIKEFKLQYYDSQKEEWVKEWDSTQISNLNRLPMVAQIDITVVETEDSESDVVLREYPFSTKALVDLYKNEINF